VQNKAFVESLLKKQNDSIKDIETLIGLLDEDKLLNENKELTQQLALAASDNRKLNEALTQIQDENIKLRLALNDQIISEKLNILKISKAKMETYFQDRQKNTQNRLINVESGLITMIQQSERDMNNKLAADQRELINELNQVRAMIQTKITERQKEIETEKNISLAEIESRFRQLQTEEVDEETILKRIKHNNLEINLGLSWLNKLGILLILFGVATGVKFGYTWFSPYMKGIFSFILGVIFLVAGEIFMRKQKNTFAMGISAGGVAILYFATFSAFFYHHILSMDAAILLSLLVTAVAVALSLRYDSKTICIFSLIGGYLPFYSYVFAIGLNGSAIYVAMAYVLLLNVMILIISSYKKWQLLNYVAFILNFPVFIYLISICRGNIPVLIFNAAVFILFLFVVIAYSLRQKVSLNVYDIILLGLNTTLSCVEACYIFGRAGWNDYLGLLALFFALFYFALGKAIEKIMGQEKIAKNLFYITSITFSILMIPFQFDMKWVSMGWTIEAVLMIVWGNRNRIGLIEGMGWAIGCLSYLSYLFNIGFTIHDPMYHIQYALITAGMITAILTYLWHPRDSVISRYTGLDKVMQIIKYLVIWHTFIFLLHETTYLYNEFVVQKLGMSQLLTSYYGNMLKAAVFLIVAVGLPKIKILQDRVVRFVSLAMLGIFDLLCIYYTLNYPLLNNHNVWSNWVALVVLLAYHGLAFANIRRAILEYISYIKYNLEFYPLSQAVYLVVALTMIMAVQFNWMANIRFVISFVNVVLAFVFIQYGLRQRYVYIRRLGLILSLLASAKLFLFDLGHLTTVGRIVSYFAFGFVLLAISYLYQKMEKNDSSIKLVQGATTEEENM